jgi:predicted RNA methylase
MDGRGELQRAPAKQALVIFGPVAAALVETAEEVASKRQPIDLGAGVGGLVQYEFYGLGAETLVVVEVDDHVV